MTSTRLWKNVTKKSVHVVAKCAPVLLSGVMFAAHAMTLGELQGEALIGRSLDLIVPVQSAAGEALAEGCVRASISYGEAQQKAPRVSLQATQLRLQLSEPVNEPVVKVQLRIFCGANQIRNYVLLADLPPGFSATVSANTPPPIASDPSALSNARMATAAAVLPQGTVAKKVKPGLPNARKPAAAIGKTKKVTKKQKTKTAVIKRPHVRKPASAQAAKSVLKLDPMEILSDRMDNLELNMPFVPAEDAMLQSRQIATLQAEVKSMRELAIKNDSALLELRSQLQQAQSQQLFTTLLYGVIALLVIAVAGLVWLWRGQKKLTTAAQSWWQHASDEDMTAFLQPEVLTKPATPAAPPPSTSNPTAVHLTINPGLVQDVRQQAEFFVSLGQDHRAVQILSQHLASSGLPNPLVCLDLLDLYQRANQTAEFNQLRDVCHQHFNVQIPELAAYQREGQDLASYPSLLTPLTRLWPGEQALTFMDSCIFLKTAARPQAPLDLAAFRDLLSLHALAEELALPTTPPKTSANRL